ncbi:MAG: RimK-like ATPgrasp N-terminal domain-containing protein [Methanoregula sp.]|jgi:hypothetical protein|nr:RimK-like ATPgrasp N-terminal domain-containing protein [Methanoregula sp.]
MNKRKIQIIPEKYASALVPGASVLPSQSFEKESGIPSNSQPFRKTAQKTNGKRYLNLIRDSLFIIKQDDVFHVISESYAYKTETYYTILHHELEGKQVRPSSSAILDAYVVPLCLERAKLAGIPVCPWGISQAFVPLPAILYGLNYFATTSDYFIVQSNDQAKEVIKHITNKGKYPVCYQKLDDTATICSSIGIFGKTISSCPAIALIAHNVYKHFSIPLVTMVFVKNGDQYFLSSLSPTKYSQLLPEERTLLAAYLNHQEFL